MSTLKVNTLQNTSGVEQYLCKAWVNFNGTGTVAIRASGNVTSITDNGTGDYTVNFTNALADANYSIAGSAGKGANGSDPRYLGSANANPTTTTCRIVVNYGTGTVSDVEYVCVAIFR